MEQFINDLANYLRVEKGASEHTVNSYINDIRGFIDHENIAEPNQITKSNIRSYLSYLMQRGMTTKTRNRKLSAIKSFCRFLCNDAGVLEDNPSLDIKTAKIEQSVPEVMTIPQTLGIVNGVTDMRDKVVLAVLYSSGLRISELASLKISDIDFENKTIRVVGKGMKQRVVPASPTVIQAIKDHIQHSKVENGFIFPSPVNSNKPISTRALRDVVYKWTGKAGDKINPHKFRHSCATHLLANGMDIRYIQELLGHADINTTTIYTKVSIDNLSRNFHLAHPLG